MQQGLNQVFHPLGQTHHGLQFQDSLYVEHISVIFNQEAWVVVNPCSGSSSHGKQCRQRHPVRCCCVLTRRWFLPVQQPCAAQSQQWRSWVPKLHLHCFQGKDVNRTVSCHSSKDLRGNRRKLPSCSTSTTLLGSPPISQFEVLQDGTKNIILWSLDMESASNPLATSLNFSAGGRTV